MENVSNPPSWMQTGHCIHSLQPQPLTLVTKKPAMSDAHVHYGSALAVGHLITRHIVAYRNRLRCPNMSSRRRQVQTFGRKQLTAEKFLLT